MRRQAARWLRKTPTSVARQGERISGAEKPPGIGLIDRRLREARAVDRPDDLALDRQGALERLHIGFPRNRALQMEN